MKNTVRIILWTFVIAITTWSIVYFVGHYGDTGFRDGALGNLFATILGVAVGIPIALEVNRRQQDAQNASALALRTADENIHKRKVLTLIRSELSQNYADIMDRRSPLDPADATKKRAVSAIPLRNELWAAFSDSGEIQHVNNPDVLAAIATAYHRVKATIYLEQEFLSASHFPGMRVSQSSPPQDRILGYLAATDTKLLSDIALAIQSIDAEIGQLTPEPT